MKVSERVSVPAVNALHCQALNAEPAAAAAVAAVAAAGQAAHDMHRRSVGCHEGGGAGRIPQQSTRSRA